MKKILFLLVTMIFCYGCVSITSKNMKEIYVVYDDSYTSFVGKYDPRNETAVKREGHELVLKDPEDYGYKWRVYRSPFNRRYWFIGKFLIDSEKNINFVPVTSSKRFNKQNYKEEDIERIEGSCFIARSRVRAVQERQEYDHYYDVEKKQFIPLTKDNPKYTDYFLYGFADYTPQYLVIKEEYGKRLMENGIILPDPNELKDQVVWQDWYNYWGLSKFKIEIP